MRPNTILTILGMKLYFGHTRLQSNTNDLINHSLQTHEVEAGRGIKNEKNITARKIMEYNVDRQYHT